MRPFPLSHMLSMMLINSFFSTSLRRIVKTTIPAVNAWTSPMLSRHRPAAVSMHQHEHRATSLSLSSSSSSPSPSSPSKMINLHSITLPELETILVSWGHKKFRAKQVYEWIHDRGVVDVSQMNNVPKILREQLLEHAAVGSLSLHTELVSKDGTIKRAYKLHDGYAIESVLMPYDDGRYTACISSQAGCAQQCVFCATGHGGFQRQLTVDEIFEQVSRFASELAYEEKHDGDNGKGNSSSKRKSHNKSKRLSNIVFMGMGEPLHNYQNVVDAIKRIQSELGIGYRRITVSTVGIVPKISKLANDLPQVRLAVSLHCADDEERTKLLPANAWNGGLDRLMETLRDFVNGDIEVKSDDKKPRPRRLTLEWALIEGENDTPEVAHSLGKLIDKWLSSRRDMIHINVIPLNPTNGFKEGRPSGRQAVDRFCSILQDRYGVTCTPRVRRGIDINAGCGQLSAAVMAEEDQKRNEQQTEQINDNDGVLDEINRNTKRDNDGSHSIAISSASSDSDRIVMSDELDHDIGWDEELSTDEEMDEATRLINLVKGQTLESLLESSSPTK